MADPVVERRSAPFIADEAKFATQKIVTIWLLFLFTFVTVWIFVRSSDASERSTVLQVVITITTIAVSFWIGTSKGAADNREQLNKMLTPQPGTTVTTTTPETPK